MADVPVCPACRSERVRRGDSLCPPCVTAARTVPPSPAWVLDSSLLRRALADVNVPAVVAIVRAACGLSQQDMAGVAGWSRSALVNVTGWRPQPGSCRPSQAAGRSLVYGGIARKP
jgi:hypothetical protein